MVPSAFVVLDELPLTPNGKVDRKALPPPNGRSRPISGVANPRTPAEKTLAEIWCEVLRMKQVGIQDNFFELGGQSLLAMRVITRAREAFHLEIPLRVLFELPTIEGLAAVITGTASARISPGDQSGLSFRSPLRPAPRTTDISLPLSFAQQRLWFFDQLSPGSSAYNVPAVFRLNGLLQFAALERSLTEIVRRHEALRTVFQAVNGSPIQLIAPAAEFPLRVINLESTPSEEREFKSRECMEAELEQPFDLSADCMLRACLLRLTQTDHILVLTLHHIASDEWSLIILLKELAVLYKAYSAGKPSPLLELPVQYADFALWQRLRLQGEALESELDYWTKQLQGDLPTTQLPADRIRTTLGTSRGARESILVPKHISDSLHALSQREHATLFTTMVAALSAALHRYTAETDLIIGSPIAGRHSLDTEKLIGFFLNTLPLRVELSGNPTFRELVRRLRPVVVQAISHQDLPFERLVEELQPERTLSRSPIFQVMLNLLNLPDTQLELEGLVVEPLTSIELDARFDLTVYVRETDQGMLLDFVYATDLFEGATIRQFASSMRALLFGVAANPDERLSRFPILEKTGRDPLASHHSIVCPSSTFVPFRKEDIEFSIPARFEQQVKRHPSRIAVKTRHCQWTYSELNREADRLKQALLRMRGPGAERIALLLQPDAPMVSALLGVLKSGKTYVVLDSSYPRERLLYILLDSEARVVVSNRKTRGLASELSRNRLPIIDLDELGSLPVDQDSRPEVPADALAYILYTSGSTGQPKGVSQKHRNVLHHIRNYTNNLKIGSEDRLLVVSSYSFDAAVMDTYGALLNGATLCPFDLKEQSWTELAMWMKSQEITVYHSTPTVYRYWLGALSDDEAFPKVRLVVLGGEEVVKRDIELHRLHFARDCVFVNGLGPTESTLALQYYINSETRIVRHSVPVGYPVDETEILLLNNDGEDAVVYGEIAIRSAYLATGYWRKPELTSKVFLSDPDGYDRRIYRTGDMGRLLPDGSLEFAGRKDFQVKLRGFRIELEEIEAVLSLHPGVRQEVLMIRESEPGEKRLVAYIVPKQGQTVPVNGLVSFLKQRLPDYMVPSNFVFLNVLPLTPSGKVDRQALPEPDDNRRELIEDYIAPSTPIEKALAEIWMQLLSLEKVGIHDNFFDLGGHSLLAMQLISRVRKSFQMELTVRSLFEAPTIADLEVLVSNFLVEQIESEEITQILNALRDG
jgi:amino acid adenylation domain-containing protein